MPDPSVATTVIALADPITQLYKQSAGNRSGATFIDPRGLLPTYRAAKRALALPATPTLAANLVGAANKIVRVRRVMVSGAAATASQIIPVDLIKYSTAATGGTATTPAAVPDDSADGAAGAVLSVYTVLPTLGTAVGTVGVKPVSFGLITAAIIGDMAVWDFTVRGDEGIVLRGVAETLGIHLGGVALANATTLNCEWEWTEEASS